MKIYNYILFDWDGCLAKTLDIWLQAYKKIFAEYDLYPDTKTITQEISGDWNGPRKLGIEDVEGFTNKLMATVNEKYPTAALYDGVKEVLSTLKKRNKKLALITTSKISIVKPALENNNLMNIFDLILAADDVKKHKPDPEIVDTAIEKLDGIKEESIIIGDSKSDLGAGKNAAIDSILFYPKHNQIFYEINMLQTYNPTYTVDDFKKILEIVI